MGSSRIDQKSVMTASAAKERSAQRVRDGRPVYDLLGLAAPSSGGRTTGLAIC
jgi:hypothetical protein